MPFKFPCCCLVVLLVLTPVLSAASVSLSWSANPEKDLSGYHIYRTLTPGNGYTRIKLLNTTTSYTDATAVAGSTYYYVVSALNASGLESPKSAEVQAAVPSSTTITNHPPTASAGNDQTVASGALVTLKGYGFDDDPGDVLSHSWTQIKGPAVVLQGANSSVVTFTAPLVSINTSCVFRLTVSDGKGGVGTNDVGVMVLAAANANRSPVASAGPDRTVSRGSTVTLSGSGNDPDGDSITYAWKQVAGQTVTLSGSNTATATFAAPKVTATMSLTFRLTVTDSKGATGSNDVVITVAKNTSPTLSIAADQLADPGSSVTLQALATDPDGDALGFSWEQVAGPAVSLTATASPALTFNAPSFDEDLIFRISVKDIEETVDAQVRVRVRQNVPLVFPLELRALDPLLADTFIGVAFLNNSLSMNRVEIAALDAAGRKTTLQTPTLTPQAQDSFLTGELKAVPAGTVAVRANALDAGVRGFFLVGDGQTNRLDGVGGELRASSTLFFPVARHTATEKTVVFLSNVEPSRTSHLTASLINSDGQVLLQKALTLGPGASRTTTAAQLFGVNELTDEVYVRVTADARTKGFELVSTAQEFASVAALSASPARTLWVPHFVLGREGEDTELRFINAEKEALRITLEVHTDGGTTLAIPEFMIPAGGLFIGRLSELLGSGAVPMSAPHLTGHVIVQVDNGTTRPANVIGTVTFTGRQAKARTMLPACAQPQLETVFLHVAQSNEQSVFTGLAVLNPNASPATVTAEVFNQEGLLTAKRTLTIQPQQRVVDLLNGARLFGPDFQQIGGHVRLHSDQPIVSFVIFGDGQLRFLAAVEGQDAVE